MQLILFLVLIVSGVTLAFFQLSAQAQRTAFRLERGEVLRQIVEAADEEAFAVLLAALENPGSTSFQWLLDQGRNPKVLPIQAPLTAQTAATMVRARQKTTLTVEARVVDFTPRDFEGVPYSSDVREGVGRIELTTICRLTDTGGGGGDAICRLIRRRDYKMAAIVTPRGSGRTGASQNAALDYALLVRQGLQEFQQTGGLMLNQNRVRLVIDAAGVPSGKRGKIRFGGADGVGNAIVWLQIDEARKSMLPTAKTPIEITNPECETLFDLAGWRRQEIEAKIKQAKEKLGSNYNGDIEDYIKADTVKKFRGIVGEFKTGVVPLAANGPTEAADKIRQYLWSEEWKKAAGGLRNVPDRYDVPSPGCAMLSENAGDVTAALAQEVLEGGIRQRFLYHATMFLDISSLEDKDKADEIAKKPWYGFNPAPSGLSGAADQRFYDRLPQVDAAKGGGHPLFSRFDASFLFGVGGGSLDAAPTDAAFPIGPLFNRRGSRISPDQTGTEGFRPYSGFGLWARRLDRAAFLRSGMYDAQAGRLHIDGIVQIMGGAGDILSLGSPDKPLLISGRGVLVAPGFQIRGEIRKADPARDLLVLMTRRGNILIDTSQPVEASLIAAGDDLQRSVIPLKPMQVTGAVVVDRLNTHQWCAGEHRLRYDEHLQVPEPLFRPAISRWVVFERLAEE